MALDPIQKDSRILIAGGRGMVGSGVIRVLKARGYTNILAPTSDELDLTNQAAVDRFYSEAKPEFALIAAARVGGIHANSTYPADFIYDNLMIASNTIHAAFKHGTEKLLFLGSSCIYPKLAPQPMKEESLLTGPLEPSNEAYALAKIAGLKLCQHYFTQYKKRFISAMPTNLYGVNDNFHPDNSHVIPGLLRRFHNAKINGDKSVTVWGTGTPKREFLHVDDLSQALVWMLESYEDNQHLNVGTGEDVTIRELAESVKEVVAFKGQIVFDSTKPDGTPRKLLDVSKIKSHGWSAKIKLKDGLKTTYEWALANGKF